MADEYRDPRNDRQVDRAVESVITRADAVCGALKELHDLLDHEIELTPRQAERMAQALQHVGLAAGHVLLGDLALTSERESEPIH